MVVTKPGTAFGTFFIQIILGINFLVADCTFFQRHDRAPFFEWYLLHTGVTIHEKTRTGTVIHIQYRCGFR
jgi:hypothetical protein